MLYRNPNEPLSLLIRESRIRPESKPEFIVGIRNNPPTAQRSAYL